MQDLYRAAWAQLIEYSLKFGYSLPSRVAPPRTTLPAILSTATVLATY